MSTPTPGAAPAATPPAASDSLIPAPAAAPAAAPSATPPAATPPAEVTPPAAATPPAATPPAATPPAPEAPKWFYSDGTPGKGEMPAWYKADKYKTVEAQAQAYVDLEKRFGAFTGAPADGKYELQLPEGVTGEFEKDHPLLTEFMGFAKDAQMNQEGFSKVLGMLVKYEAAQQVSLSEVKQVIGKDADARINAVAQWAQANLDGPGYNALRAVLAPGPDTAAAFLVIEGVVNKTRQPAVPKHGDGTVVPPAGIEAVQAKMRDPRYRTDMQYRAQVEKEMTQIISASQAA